MKDIKQDIINTGRALLALRLQNSHSGNISSRAGGRMYITRTGSMKGHLEAKDIIGFDMKRSCHDVPGASSEAGTHQGILCYDQAVIHTHCIPATLLSYRFDSIQPVDWLGRTCLKTIPVREFQRPVGSPEMEKEIPEILSRHRAMVVRAHGPFVRGPNLEETLALTFMVDFSSKILLHLEMMQVDPKQIEMPGPIPDMADWTVSGDHVKTVKGRRILKEIGQISSDVFTMELSPFFSGSLSFRQEQEMVYCPHVSSPAYFQPNVIRTGLGDGDNDFFLRLHRSVYLRSREKSVLLVHSPHALVQGILSQIENRDLIVPVDAEGGLLYPRVPVIHHVHDAGEIVDRAVKHRVVVLAGIGILAVGETPQETLHHCSSLRNICQILNWRRHLNRR